jgi:TonB family protein
METLARPDNATPDTEPELQLLLERDYADDWRRWRRAAVGSGVIHVIAVLVALAIPDSPLQSRNVPPPFVVHITPLYIPTEFTQKAPNKGKISKELTAEAIVARPKLRAPAPAPAAKPIPPAAPTPVVPPPVPQVAQAVPKPVVIEPPKIEAEAPQQPQQVAKLTAPPPPPSPVQQPKLELQEAVAPPGPPNQGQGRPLAGVLTPNPSVTDAIRAVTRGAPGTQSVGDIGTDEGGQGPGLNLPPSAGRPRSNLELKSDPMGVDFRPYLLQVLAAVRRNWFAVYPEAARLGQRGQVSLQFAIVKQGTVTKVVFSTESGAKALDQAAVAAISASNPLPPLPAEFRGDRVVLQMTFQYNMPR